MNVSWYKQIQPNAIIPKLGRTLAIAILVLAIIGVSATIIAMLFGKPTGDDYGGIATFKLDGSWMKEAYGSLAMTGRYGQSLIGSIVYAALGNKTPTVLPTLILFWLMLITFLYIRRALCRYVTASNSSLYSAAGAIVLSFLIVFINHAPKSTNQPTWASYQDFFWPSGIITYTIPLLVILTGVYAIFFTSFGTHLSIRRRYVTLGTIVFISCLFNEVQPVFLTIASSLLLLATYSRYFDSWRKGRPLFISTTIGSLLALIALFFSPGRMVRSSAIDATIAPPTYGQLLGGIENNLHYLASNLYAQPREIILLLLTGLVAALIAYYLTNNERLFRQTTRQLLPISVAGIILTVVAVIISITLVAIAYGYGAGVYSRTLALAQILYVTNLVLLAFSLSGILIIKLINKNIYLLGAILAICGVLFIASIPIYLEKILMQVNSSVVYSNAWVEQDDLLRKAADDGKNETLFLTHPANGIGDNYSLACQGPYAGSTMWLNELIFKYYGSKDRVCEKQPADQPVLR